MHCDTCHEEVPVVMRVIVAKDYNRALARPLYNCPACFEKKEAAKRGAKSHVRPKLPERSERKFDSRTSIRPNQLRRPCGLRN